MELENLTKRLQAQASAMPQYERPSEPEEPEVHDADDIEIDVDQNETDSIQDKYQKYADQEKRDRNTALMREKYEAKIKALEEEKKEMARLVKASKANLSDEDFVEGRHYNHLSDEVRELREALQQQAAINQQERQMAQLKSKFSDFDEVVNERTIARLKKEDPDAFDAINNARDIKSGGVAAYRIIKSLGLDDRQSEENARRIDQNMRKPSVGRMNHPLTKMDDYISGGFSQEERIAHNKLVEYYANGGQ